MSPAVPRNAPLLRYTLFVLGPILALLAAASPDAGASGLLANGGFEQGADGWATNAGEIEVVDSPVHDGSRAARFTGTGQPTTQYVYQWVTVQPDEDYEASGWVAATGSGLARVFLRVSWYDGSGQLLSHSDSGWLPQFDGAFYRLATEVGVSMSAARSARITAVVQADSAFAVHLDAFEFLGPAAAPATLPPPPPTAHPATTPAISPTPALPSATPRPTSRPSPTRSPRASPAQPAGPDDTPASVEPSTFPSLVNGGFEDLRADGTPFGWHKQGGEILSATDHKTEGLRSLALTSSTGSTKWAYQTVAVTGGTYYQGAADARASAGVESVFLRISWYRTDDGSGPAISSVDSTNEASPGEGFRRLSPEAVQAPAEAASAKLRLMMRPVSDQPAIAHFDAAAFMPAQPGDPPLVFASLPRSDGQVTALDEAHAPGDNSEPQQRAPVTLVNVKPPEMGERPGTAQEGSDQNYWAVALAIATAAAALAIAAAFEYWQRRRAGEERTDS
jgi:hypothetical protein